MYSGWLGNRKARGPISLMIVIAALEKRRYHKRQRRWRKWVERCQYRCRRQQQIAIVVSASLDQQRTGRQDSLKFTPNWERTPTLFGPLGVAHNIPIMGSLHNQNQTIAEIPNQSIQGFETIFDPTTMEAIALGSKVHDHLPLIV